MMNIHLAQLAILLLILSTSTSCSSFMAKKNLSQSEMSIPGVRYQHGVDMWNRARVPLPSPATEPVFEWSVDLNVKGDTTTAFVDSEGGVWYRQGESIMNMSTIVRLNPDGSIDFTRDLRKGGMMSVSEPMVVLEGAVVCITSYIPINLSDPHTEAYLTCIDLDGSIRWESDNYRADTGTNMAWRYPENMIVATGADNSVLFFSLEDGSLVETVEIKGWSAHQTVGPIPLENDAFVVYGTDRSSEENLPYVGVYDETGEKIWALGWPEYTYAMPPSLSEDGTILFGNRWGIYCINSDNGNIVWDDISGHSQKARGVNYDGNLLYSGWESEDSSPLLKLVTPNGELIWSLDMTSGISQGESQIIIYEDNTVLIGYKYGFSLINPDGTIRWTVDSADLGLPRTSEFTQWKFNPTQDGGLVAYVVDRSGGWHDKIFYLNPQ